MTPLDLKKYNRFNLGDKVSFVDNSLPVFLGRRTPYEVFVIVKVINPDPKSIYYRYDLLSIKDPKKLTDIYENNLKAHKEESADAKTK